jgi:hypothetical protein
LIDRDQRSGGPPASGAGMPDYLREAFLFRWNLLLFLGGTAAVALTPFAPVLLPLVAAGELTYLTGLVSIPRFRAAIDAKVHAKRQLPEASPGAVPPPASLFELLGGLPVESRRRFERLHARCVEMRSIAAGVRGAARQPTQAEELRTPGLDRLLWLFLRLLVSKTALDRFLASIDEPAMAVRLAELRRSLEAAQGGQEKAPDDRIVRSLQDSVAMAEMRQDNVERARKNADFVSIELDRIETKIQTLAEMAVNRQDPDFLSSQVDSAAESMRQTEKAVSELQHLTGLADQLEEPPPIMESDLREALRHDA